MPSHLIEIDSAEENRAVFAEMKRRNLFPNFWLGITDRHSEGHWVLESTGKSVDFTNWSFGEPNNGYGRGEECAHVKNNDSFDWNDRDCNYKLRTFCEM